MLVVAVPERDYFTEVNRSRWIVLAISIGLVIAAAAISELLALLVSRPLNFVARELSALVESVGDVSAHKSPHSTQIIEVDSINSSF
jgi:hypothetical protein